MAEQTDDMMERTADWRSNISPEVNSTAGLGEKDTPQSFIQSTHFPIEIGLLTHPVLDAHPTYQFLKRRLLSFHSLPAPPCSPLHPHRSPSWLLRFYTSLYQSLLSIAYSLDVSALQPLYVWYLRYAEGGERDSCGSVSPCDLSWRSDHSPKVTANCQSERRLTTRSLTPITSPNTKLHQAELSLERIESRCGRRIREYQGREIREMQDKRAQRRFVERWSQLRARSDQEQVGKAERKGVKVRSIPSFSFVTETSTCHPDSTSESPNISHPDIIPCQDSPLRYEPSLFEDSETQEAFPAILNKVAKSRLVQRRVLNGVCKAGYFYSELDSLSLHHPRTRSTLLRSEKGSLPAIRREVTVHSTSGERLALISRVRRPLVTSRVPCSFSTLAHGLLSPVNLPETQLTPGSLPNGGEYFTSNPFFKLPGKKRKLKKGKRKR